MNLKVTQLSGSIPAFFGRSKGKFMSRLFLRHEHRGSPMSAPLPPPALVSDPIVGKE